MATRASLSISEPNTKWIQAAIDSKEFSSRSEVINDLIRQARERKAREIEIVRALLVEAEEEAEREGWCDTPPDKLLAEFKEQARREGKL